MLQNLNALISVYAVITSVSNQTCEIKLQKTILLTVLTSLQLSLSIPPPLYIHQTVKQIPQENCCIIGQIGSC